VLRKGAAYIKTEKGGLKTANSNSNNTDVLALGWPLFSGLRGVF
jgi:hypothetical protein